MIPRGGRLYGKTDVQGRGGRGYFYETLARAEFETLYDGIKSRIF